MNRVVVHAIGLRAGTSLPDVQTRFPGSSIVVLPFDEYRLSNIRETLRSLRANGGDTVLFATTDLRHQRFQFFLKFFLLLTPGRAPAIVDVAGGFVPVRWTGFILSDVPSFFVEVLASIRVLVSSAVRLRLERTRHGSAGR